MHATVLTSRQVYIGALNVYHTHRRNDEVIEGEDREREGGGKIG